MSAEIFNFVRVGRGGKRAGAGRPKGAKTGCGAKARRPVRNLNRVGFVYLMQELSEPGVCKIGISQDPKDRLIGHQVSNWRKLRMVAVFDCRSQTVSERIERNVLGVFSANVISGEWLRLPPATIIVQIEKFCSENAIRLERADVQVARAVG